MASSFSGQARRLTAGVLMVPVIVIAALSSFAWSAARMEPREVPVGLVAPEQRLTVLEEGLSATGGVDTQVFADEEEAVGAIEDREVYGAFVMDGDGLTVLTASAASAGVADALARMGTALASESAGSGPVQPEVRDVVAADPDDPRGSALSSSVLPLVLTGVLGAILLTGLSRPGMLQLAGLLAASALAGLAGALITQSWLGIIGGSWLANASAIGLTVLAVASLAAGGSALLGRGGQVLAAAVMVFVGNPFAGVSSAPEMLPEPAGFIGQLLPPGAGGQLLRSTAFFDGAGAAGPLIVLLTCTALGIAGVVLGQRRSAGADEAGGGDQDAAADASAMSEASSR